MSSLQYPERTEDNPHFAAHYRQLLLAKNEADKQNCSQNVKDSIEKSCKLFDAQENYLEDISTPPSSVLSSIITSTNETDWKQLHESGQTQHFLPPVMVTGHLEGAFLQFLVSMQRAKTVLDIGMYTGYSALAMAEALPADGKVYTCDIEQYLADRNRKVFANSPHGYKINIHLGDVCKEIEALGKQGIRFDFVFIDADKPSYGKYLDCLLDNNLLTPRGTIAVDNTLMFGNVLTSPDHVSSRFNRKVKDDPRVEQVLLPLRDGVLLIRRVEDVKGQAKA